MANEAEQAIAVRLANAPTFHPVTADLFVNDWGLDAGDIVTVRSGETDYSVPIYNMSLDWRGSSMAQIQSTGNKERKPLSALKRKQFAGGRSNYMAEKAVEHYDTQFIQDRMYIGMFANVIGVRLDEDGNPMIDEETGEYIWDDEHGAEIYSRLIMSHNRAQLISAINDGQGNKVSGASVDLSASGKVLIEAINNRPQSQSSVVIQADKIDLQGIVTATEIDATKAVVESLISDNGYLGNIKASNINTGGNITASGAVIGAGVYIGTSAPYTSVADAVKSIITDTNPPEGKIGFKFNTLGNSTYQAVNFNIADTAKYKADVGIASISNYASSTSAIDYAEWPAYDDAGTLSADTYYLFKAVGKNGDDMNIKFHTPVGGGGSYDTGWAAAEDMLVWPSENTSTAGFLIKAPGSTVDTQISKSFTLAQTGNTVYAYMGGTTVATLPVTGGTGTISNMAISGALPSEPSADYNGGSLGSYNTWYTITATPNGGTAKSMKFKTPANGNYNSGWGDAVAKVVWPSEGTSAGFLIKVPSSTVGSDTSKSFTLDQSGSTVYAYMGGTTVATLPVTGGSAGISTLTIGDGTTYEPSADSSKGTLSADRWYVATATPNSGTAKTIKFKTPTSSGGGHDTVTGSDIDLNGSSAATSASKPSTKLDKKNGYINGYVWFRLSNGTWKNLRDFTISYPQETGSGTKVDNLYQKSGNFYFKLTAGKLYYYE